MTRTQLERRAQRLAQKFYDDCQALFDADDMDIDIAEGAVFDALCMAQGVAQDVINEEVTP